MFPWMEPATRQFSIALLLIAGMRGPDNMEGEQLLWSVS